MSDSLNLNPAYELALRAMLAECVYVEDVQALKHFVFHARYNHCSNICLLCDYAVGDEDDPFWSKDHAPTCPYTTALERVRKHEPLQAYIDRM